MPWLTLPLARHLRVTCPAPKVPLLAQGTLPVLAPPPGGAHVLLATNFLPDVLVRVVTVQHARRRAAVNGAEQVSAATLILPLGKRRTPAVVTRITEARATAVGLPPLVPVRPRAALIPNSILAPVPRLALKLLEPRPSAIPALVRIGTDEAIRHRQTPPRRNVEVKLFE